MIYGWEFALGIIALCLAISVVQGSAADCAVVRSCPMIPSRIGGLAATGGIAMVPLRKQ